MNTTNSGAAVTEFEAKAKAAAAKGLTHMCLRCSGVGVLGHYRHIAAGVCFACNGVGFVSYRRARMQMRVEMRAQFAGVRQ